MTRLPAFLLLLIITFRSQAQFPVEGTDIYVSGNEPWLVLHTAERFAQDITALTGKTPKILHTLPATAARLIVIGTGLDTTLKNKWEAFSIRILDHPFPGIGQALIISGSDRRGAAFGTFELSKRLGVSPWYWWADVPIPHKPHLSIPANFHLADSPVVKYRGFFINDEAPALSGWTHTTFGGFNHNLYEKVFELLLRCKANYLWPAMWGNAFNTDDTLNPVLADKYGIVMGTSHHEPMLRAQTEWKKFGAGPWDYNANQHALDSFWTDGIRHMGNHESIVTIGMRGDGDIPMSETSNISLLEKIVASQRDIIKNTTGRPADQTPQLWALYKEVQDYYDKGMRVPDDVTLLLCDDNWGNIRRLPPIDAPTRSGGYGIYYHFDYVGGPRNYKWINTNTIDRVRQQMHLAWQHHADRLWIVNVGDIKPMEFPIEFFLDYAWDPTRYPADSLAAYTHSWAARQFGPAHAKTIAGILDKYTRYNARRKPELLSPDTYSLSHYDEAETVTSDYNRLARRTDSIANLLPPQYKNAFDQLVRYPVLACANLNELYFTVALNHLYAAQHRILTDSLAKRARTLFHKDAELSKWYNDSIANGKWRHMMDQTHIGYTSWQQPDSNIMPSLQSYTPASDSWGIDTSTLFTSHYISIYNKTDTPFTCTIHPPTPWIRTSAKTTLIRTQQRIYFTVDFKKAPTGDHTVPIIVRTSHNNSTTVLLPIHNPPILITTKPEGFIQSNGYISIDTRNHPPTQPIDPRHTNRSSQSADPQQQTRSPQSIDYTYPIFLTDTGTFRILLYFAPPLDFSGRGLFYKISLDAATPQSIKIPDISAGKIWEISVSNNNFIDTSYLHIQRSGKHRLEISTDPGCMLKKIVIDTGGLQDSYLGPPESPFRKAL